MTDEDVSYMRRALELAEQGRGFVAPNPMVGAVIVRDSRIIGEGYHEAYGKLHAERNAINSCREDTNGATIYVTLEPCCHYGKTPPCTEAIIESGIKRVVVGSMDVNPLVAGQGIKILREHGITVDVGVLEDECISLNKIFYKYMSQKRPYVVMKYAMTIDGKIEPPRGEYITGEEARRCVHILRKNLSAIMVGIGTVLADDPMLDCRLEEAHNNPTRIICDSSLRIPLTSHIVRSAGDIETIIAASESATLDSDKSLRLEEAGCTIIRTPSSDGRVDLAYLMDILAKRGIDSILLEGGSTLNGAALDSRIVDEVHVHIAPKIFGGSGLAAVGGLDSHTYGACKLQHKRCEYAGEDIIIEYEVNY